MPPFTISKVLVLVALIVFVLAAFGVGLGSLNMIALGLAVWAAAALVP